MRCSSFSGLLSVTVVTTMVNMQEIATTVSMRATDDRTRSLFRALNTASLGMMVKEWKKVSTDNNDKAKFSTKNNWLEGLGPLLIKQKRISKTLTTKRRQGTQLDT